MRLPFRKRAKYAFDPELAARMRRDDADLDAWVEMDERRLLPCLDCEVGEPHACARAWWQQRYDHSRGNECCDPECVCHPERCPRCNQAIELTPSNILHRP